MLEEVPDAFDPRLECGAWRKAPAVIGAPPHTHVCRHTVAWEHVRSNGATGHLCGCGYVW